MTTLRRDLDAIYAPIEGDLKEFTRGLEKELESSDGLISQIHAHLLKMTGKFLRPALTLLASRVENKKNVDAVKLAVAIELIHTATLIHDDIIDNSPLRRNQPSIHSKWGSEISIVSGDYLYAKAFLALAGLKNVWVNEAFAQCAHIICEGEMKQIEKRNDFRMSEEQYLKIIHRKTAALFQAACMGGAFFSGTSRENVERLGDYGFQLGMAFQIVDDCLDIIGETESLGKAAGNDIYKNDVTLPLLYLFQGLDEAGRRELRAEMELGEPALFQKIKKLALESQAIDKAMGKAEGYIRQAIEDLGGLKETPFKESLTQLAHYCLERAR
ncbi:MAG: polyprenyl synthetase family protein [Candidatus Omnitrophota bacterium]